MLKQILAVWVIPFVLVFCAVLNDLKYFFLYYGYELFFIEIELAFNSTVISGVGRDNLILVYVYWE